MARIFRDCYEMIQEINRELKISGITVPVKHYQNVQLTGDRQITKELIGMNFIINKPWLKKREMLDFIFEDEAERIEQYCAQEFKDRISREGVNPGESYKIRLDLWQALMSHGDNTKFDYTYSERLNYLNQIDNVIATLKEDKNTRQGMVMIFRPDDTQNTGGNTRIPCSVSYQFLIRNNQLYVIYYIRSNDYFKHFVIDIYLTNCMQQYIVNRIKNYYPELKCGPLNYFAGSLHAYNEDLKRWEIF